MRRFFLPSLLLSFAVLSLLTLSSIVPDLLYKQLLAFVLAFILFFAASYFPFAWYLKSAKWFYWLLNVLLLALLIYGQVTRGITAWITLPFALRFQPSQLAVPVVALFLASLLPKEKELSWRNLLKILAAIFLPLLLILLEPDFGTAIILLLSMSVFVLFQRVSLRQLLTLIGVVVSGLLFLWFFVFADYQKARILSYLGQEHQQIQLSSSQESSSSYNARQALIAVGSGQLWGRGLGQGVQSHLRFLPERQTDFIFAAIAEEWGFVGSSLILLCYFLLLLYLLRLTTQLHSLPQQLFLLAIFSMFLIQILINVGMNLALLPITGVTLPLLSYGGSSLLSLFFALGIAQALLRERRRQATLTFY